MAKDEFVADFPSEIVAEGKVRILAPKLEAYGVCPSDYAPSRAPVFYNPVMEFNRDVTLLAFQVYQRMVDREISVCDPLTGTGIRGIRYAAEMQGIKNVVVGDINPRSAKLAEYNVALNGLEEVVSVENKDANRLLCEHSAPKQRFDVVDVDPFGTPVPHLDAAVQALRNKGLLAATATDMAPLCGVHAKACLRKYGGKPLRTEYCHELALRLLAGSIATAAAKHDIGIQVLFSHCSNHYIRAYAQIGYGAQKADASIKNLGYILHCFNCLHRETAKHLFSTTKKCPECGADMEYAGPLWLGKLGSKEFVESMQTENQRADFKNSRRITKFLTLIQGEADAPPTYYLIDKVGKKGKLPAPSVAAFFEALKEAGVEAVSTHFDTRSVKTYASAATMQQILRQLTQKTNPQNP
ncbi:MAG: tRNA (guanine(10)-N(2))-dimethyltransferase [Candidatus Bathyarchaeota archaeon]|nr:tRNA (guanine(10)-N(2))-dimethyltransferase [Candidatus Bathyarchaeota archaeon]